MAITHNLAPIPKWIIIDNTGLTAGGAKMYTYSSLNKAATKAVYSDPAGNFPYTNPVIFDANGTQGPFYWALDDSNLSDNYYIEVKDSDDTLLWTIDDYNAPDNSSSPVNNTSIVNNLIANNVFLDNSGDTANPINATDVMVAPSNHVGFTPAIVSPIVGTYGVVGPDIRFVKNNTAATDQITFVDFATTSPNLPSDVTPEQYMIYTCSNSPAGETYKSFQFPIVNDVANFDGQTMTFTMWARVDTTAVTLNVYQRQYFGSGGTPSAEVRTSCGSMALTTTWTKFNIQFTVPSTSGKTLGTCGDDAYYMQVDMPLGVPCEVWMTKPCLYVGAIDTTPDFADYETNDQINAVTQTPRSADTLSTFQTSRSGWVAMNDGSIGAVGSGATTRANIDTFCLYASLYTTVSDTYAPVSTGRTGAGNTMADAVADFAAGKTLTLPLQLGRMIAGYGTGAGLTARVMGESLGTETISVGDMPAHTHTITVGRADTTSENNEVGSGLAPAPGGTGTTNSTGSGDADGKMPPVTFRNVLIKL